MVAGRVASGMISSSSSWVTDICPGLSGSVVARGRWWAKTVLLQVSDNPAELVLICFLSFSLVGLKAVRGRWWEQDRTTIVKGE